MFNSIKNTLIIIFTMIIINTSTADTTVTESGIALDKQWKVAVYQFSKEHLQHSAWGLAHCERNYKLATKLSQMEKFDSDDDVLFAASFLHDMGVFKPYLVKDAEHSKTSSENIESVLKTTGFPMEKLNDVKIAVLSHMFYANVPNNQAARVLHDADTLDFLGSIGIARIISVTTRHRWATDLSTALTTIKKFNKELPLKLSTASAKKIAASRVKEVRIFIETLNAETSAGATL